MGLMGHMRRMSRMGLMTFWFHRHQCHPAFRALAGMIRHHFGVSSNTVTNWRKALGVPEQNEGTLRLQHDWAVGREDDRLARARIRLVALERAQAQAQRRTSFAKPS